MENTAEGGGLGGQSAAEERGATGGGEAGGAQSGGPCGGVFFPINDNSGGGASIWMRWENGCENKEMLEILWVAKVK